MCIYSLIEMKSQGTLIFLQLSNESQTLTTILVLKEFLKEKVNAIRLMFINTNKGIIATKESASIEKDPQRDRCSFFLKDETMLKSFAAT